MLDIPKGSNLCIQHKKPKQNISYEPSTFTFAHVNRRTKTLKQSILTKITFLQENPKKLETEESTN